MGNVFAVLDFEDIVQVGDKTRLDGSKSFAVKGTTALTTLTVKPGDDVTAISIYDSTEKNRFLDWMYADAKFDVNSSICKVYFTVGSTEYTGTVASGSYAFSALAAPIQTAMNAAGSSVTFTVTWSAQTRKLTIAGTGSFILQGFKTGNELLPFIGFAQDTDNDSSFEGELLEYGIKTLTIAAGNGSDSHTKTYRVKVISEIDDYLFSTDGDLVAEEADILKWTPPGRATFKNVHRQTQKHILDWVDQQGYTKADGEQITKASFVKLEDVRLWARYDVLTKIFAGIQNSKDDVFKDKAKYYSSLALAARNKMQLRLDLNDDKVAEENESITTWSGSLMRR